MAHSGYVTTLADELSSQSGISIANTKEILTSTGGDWVARLGAAMDAVVAYIKTQANGPGVFTETALSGGGWTVEQDKDAASGSSTGTGLDNLTTGIKKLVQTGNFTGQLDSNGATGGYYWISPTKLYRFKNRNQRDVFQKALAARLSIDLIADLEGSNNKGTQSLIFNTITDRSTLTSKKNTATTNYSTQVAAIINGGSGVAG